MEGPGFQGHYTKDSAPHSPPHRWRTKAYGNTSLTKRGFLQGGEITSPYKASLLGILFMKQPCTPAADQRALGTQVADAF